MFLFHSFILQLSAVKVKRNHNKCTAQPLTSFSKTDTLLSEPEKWANYAIKESFSYDL